MSEIGHETKEVDLTAAGRGVWLVKVPKYLSEKWRKAPCSCEVGKLKITRSRIVGSKPEVIFTLGDALARPEAPQRTDDPAGLGVPKEHKFVLTAIGNQNLVVVSQTPTADVELGTTDKLAIEGKVIQRAECRPVANDTYMKLKRLQLVSKNKPARQVKQLDMVVNNYKPVKEHLFMKEHEQRKKGEGKNIRKEKNEVTDMLFNAFEQHQYYNVKDLVRITKQPIIYLKEILKEICTYNMKAPHKNMWELKPEYRHYKEKT
ncbi:general transcription factor IIF subunit 2 [Octopus bimaculoides]|uniref:General transcription factor IIF subunit 2 n=1 Tax=Octopus bimaculoides TaxID=37653 RepID=A0A0L8FP86_OCTBM|nr:general transcription factor IIF subunit 2 [Octopus bimaculoides]|eukprot:XP_014788077.1 PREDICTED: general transcription factor IIF subunit 2-like [Octopus bimaculoides]